MDPPGSAGEDVTLQVGSLATRIVTETEDKGSSAPFEDVTLSAIRTASERGPDIQALKEVILNGFPYHNSEVNPQARLYWSVRDKLSVDDNIVADIVSSCQRTCARACYRVCTRLTKAKFAPREERVNPSTGLE